MKCTFTSRRRQAWKRPQYSRSRDWLSALAGLLLLVSTTSVLAFGEVLNPQLNAWNMNRLGNGPPAELFDRMPFFATITLAPIEKHRSHPIRGQSGGKPRPRLVNTYRHLFSEMLKGLETGEMKRLCENGLGRSIEIEFWYGDEQRFGLLGHPQRWVNILGHVSPGVEIHALSYSLNGAESKPLSFREDFKRLARTGDFNVEIDRCLLKPGENKVVLRATTRTGQTAKRGVTVFYIDDGRRWPLPYRIDWSQTPRIEDVAQVVDGKWKLTQRGVRSVQPYYDRVLAIGDSSWRDYEVSTTVTFHRFTPPNTSPNTTSVTHAAIATRWPGHDADGQQPSVKWYPLGATAEFRLTWNLDQCRWRIFDGKRPFHVESQRRRAIELEKTYRMKHRVETIDDVRSRYRVKLWPVGETEPDAWDLERHESGDLESGSALLLTHHADATFGNITVLPCGQARSKPARF